MKNWKIDIIWHWKLFDWVDYPDNSKEIQVLFIKMLFMKERTSYYFDNIGFGIDFLRNTKYDSLTVRLIAFSLHFQKRKLCNLRLVGDKS